MRTLRSTVAISGMALLLVSTAGCGKILGKAAKEGIKAATHGSVDIKNNGVTVHDSNGNSCTETVKNDTAKTVCVDSNGDTVVNGNIDSNGAHGTITDSNGDTCSGSFGSDTGSGSCVDSNGDTTVTGHADTDTAGVTVHDSNDSTTYQSGSGSKLPSGWPSELNPPKGANLGTSVKSGTTSEIVFTVKNGNADTIYNTFDSNLKSAGWSRTSTATINGSHVAAYTKGKQSVSLQIAKTDGSTDVNGVIAITATNS